VNHLQAGDRASYRELEQRMIRHVGGKISDPLVRDAVRTAVDYAFAVSAGHEHRAAFLLRRYERITSKLGHDPLA
jgi:hypothetical protein